MTERTTRQLAAGQVRSLRAIRKKILALSAQWGDVDEFNMNELERLANECETVAVGLMPTQEVGELR